MILIFLNLSASLPNAIKFSRGHLIRATRSISCVQELKNVLKVDKENVDILMISFKFLSLCVLTPWQECLWRFQIRSTWVQNLNWLVHLATAVRRFHKRANLMNCRFETCHWIQRNWTYLEALRTKREQYSILCKVQNAFLYYNFKTFFEVKKCKTW